MPMASFPMCTLQRVQHLKVGCQMGTQSHFQVQPVATCLHCSEILPAGLLRILWWSGSSGPISQLWDTEHQISSADLMKFNQHHECASARRSSQPKFICGTNALCFKVENGFKKTDLFKGPYWHAVMSLGAQAAYHCRLHCTVSSLTAPEHYYRCA